MLTEDDFEDWFLVETDYGPYCDPDFDAFDFDRDYGCGDCLLDPDFDLDGSD